VHRPHIADAVEPREAQRPTSLAARTPKAVALGNKVFAVGVLAGREVRPAGCVGLPYRGGDPPWRLPALHPLVSRGKENRDTGHPRPPENQAAGPRSVG
jgi:hypothetical protein